MFTTGITEGLTKCQILWEFSENSKFLKYLTSYKIKGLTFLDLLSCILKINKI